MKRLLARLVAAYVSAGTVAFLLYRSWYRRTSEVRQWTDHTARQMARTLDEMRLELRSLSKELRRESGSAHRAAAQDRRGRPAEPDVLEDDDLPDAA